MPSHHFLRFFLCLIGLMPLMSQPVHAWNVTGHREVVAVAWSTLDLSTRDRVQRLIASQAVIPETPGQTAENAWMAASLWPDALREAADPMRGRETAPTTPQQWLTRARIGNGTRLWHFSDRDISRPFHHQDSHGLLEQALVAQIRLLGDESLSHPDRAIALAWVSHLVADAHQPLHCASRSVPGHSGEMDAGGNLVTVIDAGRKPPEPLSLHRWWDELPGHARPGSGRFDRDLVRLLREARQISDDNLRQPPLVWIEESFKSARDQVYPGLVPNADLPGTFLIRQDYWLESRDLTAQRLALAGRRLAFVVTQALKDLP